MSLLILSLVGGAFATYGGIKKAKSGGDKIVEANKKIEKANKRNTDNINRLNNETERTNKSLAALGKKECDIIEGFGEFIEVWEKIQNKPEFKKIDKDDLHLPEYDLESIKKAHVGLATVLELAKEAGESVLISLSCGGVAGKIVTSLPTLKVLLTNVVSLAKVAVGIPSPIMVSSLGAGLVAGGTSLFMGAGSAVGLLIAGNNLDKKGDKRLEDAEETLKKVIENEEKVKEFAEFCNTLRDTSYRLYLTLTSLQTKYKSYMVELHRIADLKDEEFSESDMLKMKNAVLLVSLLYKLCALELVKGENGDELNNVEVEKQIEEAEKIKETL